MVKLEFFFLTFEGAKLEFFLTCHMMIVDGRAGDATMTRGHALTRHNMRHGDQKLDASLEAYITVLVL